MKIKFINATILLVESGEYITSGELCVTDDTITYVGKTAPQNFVADKEIDCKGDILCPGFINTHSHNAMTLFRGAKDDVLLMDWLFKTIFKAEEHLTDEDVYIGTKMGVLENVAGGVTTCLDEYMFTKSAIKATQEVGMRMVASLGVLPMPAEEVENKLEEEYANILPILEKTTSLICSNHSIYTNNELHLASVIRFAEKYNFSLTIHLSETQTEVENCKKQYGKSPVEYLEYLGYFKRHCVCAHCVWLSEKDMEILARNKVSVASCPASNLKLGSGIANLKDMIDFDINVCLGTDGPASNNSLNFFKEMYLASCLQKGVNNQPELMPARKIVQMATINGAKSLGRTDLGELKVGFKADIVRINIHSVNTQPVYDPYNLIVYSAGPENVLMTMVDGEIIYNDKEFLKVKDLSGVYEEFGKVVDKYKKIIEDEENK